MSKCTHNIDHTYSRQIDQEYPRKCIYCGEVEPNRLTEPQEPSGEAPATVFLFTPETDISPYELAEAMGYLFNCRDGHDARTLYNKMHPMAQRHFTQKPIGIPDQLSLPLAG